MLRLDLNFPHEFVDLYNKFNSTEKGKQFLQLSGISRDKLDVATISKEYFNDKVSDISVDPNANQGQRKSFNTYCSVIMGGIQKLNSTYLIWKYLKELFDLETANEQVSNIITGRVYAHDMTKWLCPYCISASTSNIMYKGRPYGNPIGLPPKRSTSFINQCIEHLMSLSQEFAGAIALGDLLINYSWYIYNEINGDIDLLNDKQINKKIENDFQSFVFIAGNDFRINGDSPFSNLSLYCRETIKRMFSDYKYPDEKSPIDILEFIMNIQTIFINFISKKDPTTRIPYKFPICTINLFVDKQKNEVSDKQFLNILCKYNYQGVFNIYITNDKAKISSCCRLTSSAEELMKFRGIDSFGNGGLNIGSDRVVTVNLVRLARESKFNMLLFIEKIKECMEDCCKILLSHRILIKDLIEKGFLKFFKPLNWFDLDSMFFSTIGFIGIYESMLYLNNDLLNGQNEVIDILKIINSNMSELSLKYNMPLNIEQIPGEGAAITLAKKDLVYFGDNPNVIYGNQFIPLWVDVDLVKRAEIDGKLSRYFGGGVISHLNVSNTCSESQMHDLITFAIKCGLEHFALNMCFAKCENSHTTLTNGNTCLECGGKVIEKYTRIVGYLVPISAFTKIRREYEFPMRRFTSLNIQGQEIKEKIN